MRESFNPPRRNGPRAHYCRLLSFSYEPTLIGLAASLFPALFFAP